MDDTARGTDEEARIAVLYEGAEPAADDPAPGEHREEQQQQQQEPRPEDTLYEGDYAVNLDPLAEAAGDQAQEVLSETQRVFRELSLNGHEATTAADLMNRYGAEPAGEAQRLEWRNQVVSELRDAYPADWRSRLDRTMQRVTRDAKLVQFLEYSGLGDHPDVVRRLVERYGQGK